MLVKSLDVSGLGCEERLRGADVGADVGPATRC